MKPKELEQKCKEKTDNRGCYFLDNSDQLSWMQLNDKKLMPHISLSYRVNHCPICGVYVRDIEIPYDNQPPNGA